MSFHQLLKTYYRDNGIYLNIIKFHQIKDIKVIVIITYYCDLFESCPLERVLFHQLLTTYYKDNGIHVSIIKFHQIKDIKLIVITTYYCDLFECCPLERVLFHHS